MVQTIAKADALEEGNGPLAALFVVVALGTAARADKRGVIQARYTPRYAPRYTPTRPRQQSRC